MQAKTEKKNREQNKNRESGRLMQTDTANTKWPSFDRISTVMTLHAIQLKAYSLSGWNENVLRVVQKICFWSREKKQMPRQQVYASIKVCSPLYSVIQFTPPFLLSISITHLLLIISNLGVQASSLICCVCLDQRFVERIIMSYLWPCSFYNALCVSVSILHCYTLYFDLASIVW